MNRLRYGTHWLRRRLWKRVLHPIYARLLRDTAGDSRRSMIVAGTGRSGTTWLARIISSQLPCRLMFEPFHSRLVPDYAGFNYFQYMRPEAVNRELFAYCERVFSGAIRHPWIDRMVDTVSPEVRLIKEIRANLFLKWITRNFAGIPHLFVIRHPCAVVQSRMHLGWATDGDIEPFLSQAKLVEDHLADKMDIIGRAATPEQKHAIIWCISNLVPLRQFAAGELNIVFYEHLCTRPEIELPRMFGCLGQKYDPSTIDVVLDQPAPTATRDSAVMRGRDKVTGWKSQLAVRQIDDILSIVEAFGLHHLYGDSVLPIAPEAFRPGQ